MDYSFRLFVGECDNFLGLRLPAKSDSFGDLSASFLTAFRDEYPKMSSFAFPVLWDAEPGNIDIDDALGTQSTSLSFVHLTSQIFRCRALGCGTSSARGPMAASTLCALRMQPLQSSGRTSRPLHCL
ncbi:hypothetical protein FA95DRAFT_1555316 [Auriscalpium vulgare]|uniref:Uncharacterized protein n=1 Tax=Auriscalpium vulgare TaxID=40419 RepID=A0ACB8S3H4_9AGAM|nr:hypothetical protein FA95DRAFT_1555316 [Auriscalpium vulgare]